MKYAFIVNALRALSRGARKFAAARRGNVAMIFGLTLVPIVLAGGAGIDLTRALTTRNAMQYALDAAALAVATAPSGSTPTQLTTIAQNYFNANYHLDPSFGVPAPVVVTTTAQTALVSTTSSVPTTLMQIALINTVPLSVSSTVTWGQTKLWVSFVLDNTGSMTQTDASGLSKIDALKTAVNQVLTMLKGASATPGDVEAAIIPFSKTVNVGTANASAAWLDWTDWEAPPANAGNLSNVGPGSPCPWSNNTNGYTCQQNSTNGASTVTKVPASGLICPSMDNGNVNSGRLYRYYNGCYTTTGAKAPFTHVWAPNAHTTWTGCVMDRDQDYDTNANSGANYPTENSAGVCVPTTMYGTLGYDWSALTNEVNSMTAGGSTNQTIGLAWGMQAQTQGGPLSAPALPANTSQFIILVTDGLNTQDRWTGDGGNQDPGTDARMLKACANAKAAGYVIYTVYIDLAGTQGNSSVLQTCASDASKYFDLQSSGAIISTLNNIGTQITNMRVSN